MLDLAYRLVRVWRPLGESGVRSLRGAIHIDEEHFGAPHRHVVTMKSFD